MVKRTASFICQSCGAVSSKWQGKCKDCGEWNSLVEESVSAPISKGVYIAGQGKVAQLFELEGEESTEPRFKSGIQELDRVTGGGFVNSSAILLGGDPGIGKSTLLIQAAARLALNDIPCIYISGEEAIEQVRLRAKRLGLAKSPVKLAAETNVEDILATLKTAPKTRFVIIDSIQTLWTSAIDSAPGTVSQVRASAHVMINYAKQNQTTIVLVGHVTKDGQIAGPRVVEHMVDAVLYFEGDRAHGFRILRAVKNRFGPCDEIGVFAMSSDGLNEVSNPSELFLGERETATPGTAVFSGMEGSRPILVEFQALVSPTNLGMPRRSVIGWDSNRLSMIIAVLEAHCGVKLGKHDVYLNVAGGLKINEPAADLAAAIALVSSLGKITLPIDCVYFGEVSLAGSIRNVSHQPLRLKEAQKLGFTKAIIPKEKQSKNKDPDEKIESTAYATLMELVVKLLSYHHNSNEAN